MNIIIPHLAENYCRNGILEFQEIEPIIMERKV